MCVCVCVQGVCLIDWISDTRPQECTDLQSPVKCLECMVFVSTKASFRLCAEWLHGMWALCLLVLYGNPFFLVAKRLAIDYVETLC